MDWRKEKKKKREWLFLTNCPREINMLSNMTHLLNLRIGLENRKEKREWLLLTNYPCEINIFFHTTHHLNLIGEQKKEERVVTINKLFKWNERAIYRTHSLNLRIWLENRKRKREWLTLDKLSMWNQHTLPYNSPSKFEDWIGEQKKEERVVTLNKLSMWNQHAFYRTDFLNLRIGLENRKKRLLLTNCPREINMLSIQLTS